jgi:hypothetical protein
MASDIFAALKIKRALKDLKVTRPTDDLPIAVHCLLLELANVISMK